MHFIEKDFELLKLLDVNVAVRSPTIEVFHSEERKIDMLLKTKGVDLSRPVIGLHFAASWSPSKAWEFDKIVSLVKHLYERYRSNLVLLGDNAEKEKGKKLIQAVDFKIFDFIGTLCTMNYLCTFLRRCSVLITTDSGPGHLANAVSTPVVVLFGPTNPNLCRPYGKKVFVVKRDIECSPCYPEYRACHRDVDEKFLCMKEILIEDVLRAVKKAIQSKKRNGL
jgi:ADP-heptose:LPS heptosyltransferase